MKRKRGALVEIIGGAQFSTWSGKLEVISQVGELR